MLFHWAPSAISTFFENSVEFEKNKKTLLVSFCPSGVRRDLRGAKEVRPIILELQGI